MSKNAYMTAAKKAEILTRVQLNPEIGTASASYVGDLIDIAANTLMGMTGLPRYPELSQGFARGADGASVDISSIESNEIHVAVNTAGFVSIVLTLANGVNGLTIAAELQAQIRAVSDTDGFDEVTVAFDSDNTRYTATSGRYGQRSQVRFRFDEAKKHVAQALGLSPDYGGIRVLGFVAKDGADDIVTYMTTVLFRKAGIEGSKTGAIPGDFTFEEWEFTPHMKMQISDLTRLWSGRHRGSGR